MFLCENVKNSSKVMRRGPYRAALCLLTAVVFLANTFLVEAAWAFPAAPAAGGGASAGPLETLDLNVETFELPARMGTITDRHDAGEGARVVVHIQDAHCNYACQMRIAEMIEHLSGEYGVENVNLEGGAGEYDLSVFTRIRDAGVRRRVAEHFVKEGLLNGAEFFAVNAPGSVELWGVENTELYLANLNSYRDSLENRLDSERHLKALREVLNDLKRHMYSPGMLELDMKYISYKEGSLELREYLRWLLREARGRALEIKDLTNIYLLHQSLEKEEGMDFRTANMERNALIDELERSLSGRELEALVARTVEFKKQHMTEHDYYTYLSRCARLAGEDLENYPELRRYMVYLAIYAAIDRGQVMSELERLADKLREELAESENEKELALMCRHLTLLENLFNARLTKEEYGYYLENTGSFIARKFTSFIERHAPRYRISARPGSDIAQLDGFREDMARFYGYAFERDEAFIANLRTGTSAGEAPAVLVTGGFHAGNLARLFRKEGISFVSIMPEFRNEPDYVSPYFELLAGSSSGLLASLSASLSAIQIASFLNGLGHVADPRSSEMARVAAIAISHAENAGGRAAVRTKEGDYLLLGENGDGRYEFSRTRSLPEGAEVLNEAGLPVDISDIEQLLWAFQQMGTDRVIAQAFDNDKAIAVERGSQLFSAVRELLTTLGREDLEASFNELLRAEGKGVWVIPRLENAHAGGRGVYVTETASPREQALQIVHELIAGTYVGVEDVHGLAEEVEGALRSGDEKRIRLAKEQLGARGAPGTPVWHLGPEDRMTRERDHASGTTEVSARERQEGHHRARVKDLTDWIGGMEDELLSSFRGKRFKRADRTLLSRYSRLRDYLHLCLDRLPDGDLKTVMEGYLDGLDVFVKEATERAGEESVRGEDIDKVVKQFKDTGRFERVLYRYVFIEKAFDEPGVEEMIWNATGPWSYSEDDPGPLLLDRVKAYTIQQIRENGIFQPPGAGDILVRLREIPEAQELLMRYIGEDAMLLPPAPAAPMDTRRLVAASVRVIGVAVLVLAVAGAIFLSDWAGAVAELRWAWRRMFFNYFHGAGESVLAPTTSSDGKSIINRLLTNLPLLIIVSWIAAVLAARFRKNIVTESSSDRYRGGLPNWFTLGKRVVLAKMRILEGYRGHGEQLRYLRKQSYPAIDPLKGSYHVSEERDIVQGTPPRHSRAAAVKIYTRGAKRLPLPLPPGSVPVNYYPHGMYPWASISYDRSNDTWWVSFERKVPKTVTVDIAFPKTLPDAYRPISSGTIFLGGYDEDEILGSFPEDIREKILEYRAERENKKQEFINELLSEHFRYSDSILYTLRMKWLMTFRGMNFIEALFSTGRMKCDGFAVMRIVLEKLLEMEPGRLQVGYLDQERGPPSSERRFTLSGAHAWVGYPDGSIGEMPGQREEDGTYLEKILWLIDLLPAPVVDAFKKAVYYAVVFPMLYVSAYCVRLAVSFFYYLITPSPRTIVQRLWREYDRIEGGDTGPEQVAVKGHIDRFLRGEIDLPELEHALEGLTPEQRTICDLIVLVPRNTIPLKRILAPSLSNLLDMDAERMWRQKRTLSNKLLRVAAELGKGKIYHGTVYRDVAEMLYRDILDERVDLEEVKIERRKPPYFKKHLKDYVRNNLQSATLPQGVISALMRPGRAGPSFPYHGELREYRWGDDLRYLDWKASARSPDGYRVRTHPGDQRRETTLLINAAAMPGHEVPERDVVNELVSALSVFVKYPNKFKLTNIVFIMPEQNEWVFRIPDYDDPASISIAQQRGGGRVGGDLISCVLSAILGAYRAGEHFGTDMPDMSKDIPFSARIPMFDERENELYFQRMPPRVKQRVGFTAFRDKVVISRNRERKALLRKHREHPQLDKLSGRSVSENVFCVGFSSDKTLEIAQSLRKPVIRWDADIEGAGEGALPYLPKHVFPGARQGTPARAYTTSAGTHRARGGGMWFSPETPVFGTTYGRIAYVLETFITVGTAAALWANFGLVIPAALMAAGIFALGHFGRTGLKEHAGAKEVATLTVLTGLATGVGLLLPTSFIPAVAALLYAHYRINLSISKDLSHRRPFDAFPADVERMDGASARAFSYLNGLMFIQDFLDRQMRLVHKVSPVRGVYDHYKELKQGQEDLSLEQWISYLEDKSEYRQRLAVLVLKFVGMLDIGRGDELPADILKALEERLEDSNWRVRRAAFNALRTFAIVLVSTGNPMAKDVVGTVMDHHCNIAKADENLDREFSSYDPGEMVHDLRRILKVPGHPSRDFAMRKLIDLVMEMLQAKSDLPPGLDLYHLLDYDIRTGNEMAFTILGLIEAHNISQGELPDLDSFKHALGSKPDHVRDGAVIVMGGLLSGLVLNGIEFRQVDVHQTAVMESGEYRKVEAVLRIPAFLTGLGKGFGSKTRPRLSHLDEGLEYMGATEHDIETAMQHLAVYAVLSNRLLCGADADLLTFHKKWEAGGLPYAEDLLIEYVQDPSPDTFAARIVEKGRRFIREGFAPDDVFAKYAVFAALREEGIDISFPELDKRIKGMLKMGAGYFRRVFRKTETIPERWRDFTIDAEAGRLRYASTANSILSGNFEKLTRMQESIDEFKWLEDCAKFDEGKPENRKTFTVRNLYFLMQKRLAKEKVTGRFRVEYPDVDRMKEDLLENRSLYYEVAFGLASNHKHRERQLFASIMMSIIVSEALFNKRDSIVPKMMAEADNAAEIESRLEAFENFYGDSIDRESRARFGLKKNISSYSDLAPIFGELSREVSSVLLEEEGRESSRSREKYRFVAQGFAGVFRGRAGIHDCSFEKKLGAPYTRAMHEDTIYYHVYKGNKLKGYIGMMLGKTGFLGRRVLTIDTIQSSSFGDNDELLTDLLVHLDKLAADLGCAGIAFPADVSYSFNFRRVARSVRKLNIDGHDIYKRAERVKVVPVHRWRWYLFRWRYGRDVYNSIDVSRKFRLLDRERLRGAADLVPEAGIDAMDMEGFDPIWDRKADADLAPYLERLTGTRLEKEAQKRLDKIFGPDFVIPGVRLLTREEMNELDGRDVVRNGSRVLIVDTYWHDLSDDITPETLRSGKDSKLNLLMHEAMAYWCEKRGIPAEDIPMMVEGLLKELGGTFLREEDKRRAEAHRGLGVDRSMEGEADGVKDPEPRACTQASKALSHGQSYVERKNNMRKRIKEIFVNTCNDLPEALRGKVLGSVASTDVFHPDLLLAEIFPGWEYSDELWFYDLFPYEDPSMHARVLNLKQLVMMDRLLASAIQEAVKIQVWKRKFDQAENRSGLLQGYPEITQIVDGYGSILPSAGDTVCPFETVLATETIYGFLAALLTDLYPFSRLVTGEVFGFQRDEISRKLFEMASDHSTFEYFSEALDERIRSRVEGVSLDGVTLQTLVDDAELRNRLMQVVFEDLMGLWDVPAEAERRMRRSRLPDILNRSYDGGWVERVIGEVPSDVAGIAMEGHGEQSFEKILIRNSLFGSVAVKILYHYETGEGFFGYSRKHILAMMSVQASDDLAGFARGLDQRLEDFVGMPAETIRARLESDDVVRGKVVETVFNYFMELLGDSRRYHEFYERALPWEQEVTCKLTVIALARKPLKRLTPWEWNNLRLCNGFWPAGPEQSLGMVSRGINSVSCSEAFSEQGLMAPGFRHRPGHFTPLSTSRLPYGGVPWSRGPEGAIFYFQEEKLNAASEEEILELPGRFPGECRDDIEIVVKDYAHWDALRYMFVPKRAFEDMRPVLGRLGLLAKVVVVCNEPGQGISFFFGDRPDEKRMIKTDILGGLEGEIWWHLAARLAITEVFKEEYLERSPDGITLREQIINAARAKKGDFTPEELAVGLGEDADIVIDALIVSKMYSVKGTAVDAFGKRILRLGTIGPGETPFSWEDITRPLDENETRMFMDEQEKMIKEKAARYLDRRYPPWRRGDHRRPRGAYAKGGESYLPAGKGIDVAKASHEELIEQMSLPALEVASSLHRGLFNGAPCWNYVIGADPTGVEALGLGSSLSGLTAAARRSDEGMRLGDVRTSFTMGEGRAKEKIVEVLGHIAAGVEGERISVGISEHVLMLMNKDPSLLGLINDKEMLTAMNRKQNYATVRDLLQERTMLTVIPDVTEGAVHAMPYGKAYLLGLARLSLGHLVLRKADTAAQERAIHGLACAMGLLSGRLDDISSIEQALLDIREEDPGAFHRIVLNVALPPVAPMDMRVIQRIFQAESEVLRSL